MQILRKEFIGLIWPTILNKNENKKIDNLKKNWWQWMDSAPCKNPLPIQPYKTRDTHLKTQNRISEVSSMSTFYCMAKNSTQNYDIFT